MCSLCSTPLKFTLPKLTEFNVGDEVKFETFTTHLGVVKERCCGGNAYYVSTEGAANWLHVETTNLTLVKAAPPKFPPRPKPGTVVRTTEISHGKYIVHRDGSTTYVQDDTGVLIEGVYEWDDKGPGIFPPFNHSTVTVVGYA